MLKYLLDTNMCIFTIKCKPTNIRKYFNINSSRLCISSITLMELLQSAEKSLAPEINVRVIEGFIARLNVLSFDAAAAAHSGQISAELRRQGAYIAPLSMMIAGHARSQGLVIVTNNICDFACVKGLRTEDWCLPEDVRK
ncbi:TPA: tRNA(fMet)-specific endonuclease VapC [Serratia marcescens]|nr:tRNA(fMet)-specific endonuclease VapC [Serratia marcescens]